MIERKLTNIEIRLIGETWATRSMSFIRRLKFFRDTGEWPGLHLKGTTEIFLQNDIDREREDGMLSCVERKLERGKEAGLNVK